MVFEKSLNINKDLILMLIDQSISSLFSFIIPAFIFKYLGKDTTEEFVIVQSYFIYFNSILSATLINPYLYLENINKGNKKNLKTLSIILFSITLISSLVFLNNLSNQTYLLTSIFISIFLKDSIRTINIHNNKIIMNIIFQVLSIIPLLIFFINENYSDIVKLYFIIISVFSLTFSINNIAKKSKIRLDYFKESVKLGQWSLYNMILQLIITRIIISKIQEYNDQNIVISYGILITILNLINPIVLMINNYTIKVARHKKSTMNKGDVILWFNKYKRKYLLFLIIIFPLILFMFKPITTYFYDNEYNSLVYIFSFLYVGIIFGSFNQLNSRILTIFNYRKIVAQTGFLSLLCVGIISILPLTNSWYLFLILALILNKYVAFLWSSWKIKVLNVS